MLSLSPFKLGAEPDLVITGGTTDTIHVTDSYTVDAGETLKLGSSPGIKLEVKNGSDVSLDIEGTASLRGNATRGKLIGIVTTQSVNGDCSIHIGQDGLLSVSLKGSGQAVGVDLTSEGGVLDNEGEIRVTAGDGPLTLGALLQATGTVFTNEGEVHVQAASDLAFGVIANLTAGAADVSMTNFGLIEVTGESDQAYGFASQSTGGVLDNQGQVVVQGATFAAGMLTSGDVSVSNSGSIEASSGGEGDGGVGVQLASTNGMTNTGDIRASGPDGAYGVWFLGAGVLDNSGSIIATGSDAAAGVYLAANNPFEVMNSGLIRGAYSIVAQDALNASFSTRSEDTVINSGKLVGDLLLGGDDDSFSNSGRVIGDVSMGDGDDVVDTGLGRLDGVVTGGLGADTITGSTRGDVLYGDETDDAAGGGADVLRGMKGDDSLFGGQGDDALTGNAGADSLSGGAGADVFKFTRLSDSTGAASDLITDLTNADQIDLHLIDADAGTGGDQAFHLVGAFTGHAGELTVAYDGGAGITTISGDVDGDGDADLVIRISGDSSGFTNFVL